MTPTATNDLERLQVIEIMLMDQHKHIQEVADHLGITRVRLWQICKANGINPHRPIERECKKCGKKFDSTRVKVRDGGGHYCTEDCYHEHQKEVNNYNPWRQSQRKSRALIEEFLGCQLPEGFIVHHEDGNHRNWGFGNIYVFPSQSEHIKYHHAKRNGKGVLPYKNFRELPKKMKEWLLEIDNVEV